MEKKKGKKTKKILIAVLIIIAVFIPVSVYFSAENSLKADSSIYFYKDTEDASDKSVNADEITNYAPEISKYSSRQYYNNLTEKEKFVYNAVIYAFEHNETCVFMPEEYVPADGKSLEDILYFAALDSPLVEQNLSYSGEPIETETYIKDSLGFTHKKVTSGSYIYVTCFTAEKTELKKQAIEKAKKIVSSIPTDCNTDEKKAKYVFSYIADNCVYTDYADSADANYLYDALVLGRTNCDGFANAYSLIMNMCGIDCFEKMVNGVGSEPGHTWNCVKIDGNYYNVDVTYASSRKKDEYRDMYFAFPDCYCLEAPMEYSDIISPCTDKSLTLFDCDFTTESDSQIVGKLVSEFRNNSNKYVCAYFDSMTVSRLDSIAEKFVYRVDTGIQYIHEDNGNDIVHTVVIYAD